MAAQRRPFVFKSVQKSSHSRNCESLIINDSIGSDIHVYTDVTPIMEFTLLDLSFEVHLCIALKKRKIADFEIVLNYFFSLIAACAAASLAICTLNGEHKT